MPTIIDELVIKLAFDMEGLKKRGDETNAQLKTIRESAEKTGKDMENSGKRAAQFFASAKTEALALMAVLTGGAGLITAAAATAASIADLGRAAQNLNGMDPRALDAWGMALKRISGDAEGAVTSFNNVGAALARYRLKGDTAIIPFLNAIGAQTTMTPEQIAIKFSEYIKAHPEKTAQEVNVIGQGLGMTQSMTNLLRQGPDAVRRELELSGELGLRTQAMIDTATKFQHDFEALNQAARHLTDRMMTQMMPTMDAFVVALTHWITKNLNTDEAFELIARAVGIGGAVIGGAAGISVTARMLGLPALSGAVGVVTAALLKFGSVLNLLSLTGPAGGQATAAETDATTERLRREGLLAPGSGAPFPSNYLDPNSGPSIWGWVKNKLGFGGGTATGGTAGPATITASADLSLEERRALDAIAGGEQSSSGYASQNPTSSAYGRYQFIDSTRRALLAQMGLPPDTPLTPKLQDRMALRLMRNNGWTPDMSPEQTAAILNKIWPSLPGGSQQNTSASTFSARWSAAELAERQRAAGPRVDKLLSPDNSLLLPSPGARGESSNTNPSNDNRVSLDIGAIHVHTAATNAHGIAKEIHGAISDQMIQQANRGLV